MLSLCMNRTMLLKQYNDKIKGNKPTPPPPSKKEHKSRINEKIL